MDARVQISLRSSKWTGAHQTLVGNCTVADEQARWFCLHCVSWTWGSCCTSISKNIRCIMTHSICCINSYVVITLRMSSLITLTDHVHQIGPWTTIFYVWSSFHLPDWDFKFEHWTNNHELKLSCVLLSDDYIKKIHINKLNKNTSPWTCANACHL